MMTVMMMMTLPVYVRDTSAQTFLRASILRKKLQIILFVSPSHNILTGGQPVSALTYMANVSQGNNGVPVFK